MYLVSIIVPVYNTELYIEKCIVSILEQTYTNFELLLIDDGSSDTSGSICNSYANKDKRIRTFRQNNAGVSAARNKGLDEARGEFVCFADSDDWVLPNYVESMVESQLGSQSELVFAGWQACPGNGSKHPAAQFPDVRLQDSEIVKAFTELDICNHGGPVSKLYKLAIIKKWNIRFDTNMRYAEDYNFMLCYLLHINNIQFISAQSYIYRIEVAASLSKKLGCFEQELYILQQIQNRLTQIYNRFGKHSDDVNRIGSTLMHYVIRCAKAVYLTKPDFTSRYNLLKSIYRHVSSPHTLKSYVPYCLHEHIQYILLKHKSIILLDIYYRIFHLYTRVKK